VGSKSRSMGAPSRVRLACALGAVSFSNVGEVCVGKATNGESGNRPQRAQVHLLPVSCVIAASHRALNATNRDEKPAFQSDGLAAFGMSFAPLWPPKLPNSTLTSNQPRYWLLWSHGDTEHV